MYTRKALNVMWHLTCIIIPNTVKMRPGDVVNGPN